MEWALTSRGEGRPRASYSVEIASTIHLLIVCLEAGDPFLGDPKHTNNWSVFLHWEDLRASASKALTGGLRCNTPSAAAGVSWCWWLGLQPGSGLPGPRATRDEFLKLCRLSFCLLEPLDDQTDGVAKEARRWQQGNKEESFVLFLNVREVQP